MIQLSSFWCVRRELKGLGRYDVKTFTTSADIGSLTKLAHSLRHHGMSEAFADRDVSFMQWLVLTKLRGGVALTPGHLSRHAAGHGRPDAGDRSA